MKRSQIDGNKQGEEPLHSEQPGGKHKFRSMARFFVIDLLIAAILLGSFYVKEYGMPFSQRVYAVVADTESSQILLNLAAATDAAAATETAAVTTSGTDADTQTEAGTSENSAVITDNTYSGDNLQITVTQHSSGSGNSKIIFRMYTVTIKHSLHECGIRRPDSDPP